MLKVIYFNKQEHEIKYDFIYTDKSFWSSIYNY